MFDNGLINPIYQTFSSRIGIEEDHFDLFICFTTSFVGFFKGFKEFNLSIIPSATPFYFYNSVLEIGKHL
jgi:hypothetical protein